MIRIIIAFLLVAYATSAADLALAGTWKLKRGKSRFSIGQVPKSLVITIDAEPNGLRYTSKSVTAEGRELGMTYSAKFDGKEYPIADSDRYDSISWTRVDNRTFLSVTRKAGQQVGGTKYVVSPDGKTFTRTGTAKRPGGDTNQYTELFERQ